MYTSDITVDNVIDALSAVLAPLVVGGQIVRSQVNRVALPTNPCCVLTEILQADLSVPFTQYSESTVQIYGPSRIDIQIDFYGAQAGEFCKTAKTILRSQWGNSQFPTGIKSLYTSDAAQAPLTSGEQQYISRWTMTAHLQYNPTVTVPQASANTLGPVGIVAADLL